jgi:hypothetical protein
MMRIVGRYRCVVAAAAVFAGVLASGEATAAILYSNVTPQITDISTLVSLKVGTVYVGAFGDTGSQYTTTMGEWAYGMYLSPTAAGTLTHAQIPLDIGAPGTLRMELYEVPAIPAANTNPTSQTIASYSLLDTATVTGLTGGRHWATFDFTPGGVVSMDTAKSYLLFVTITQVGSNRWATKQHYWLGRNVSSPTARMLRTYDTHAYSALVPEHNMGVPYAFDSRQPGIYLSSVPEPTAIAGISLVAGATMLHRRRRTERAESGSDLQAAAG